jgi:hypothetical protein
LNLKKNISSQKKRNLKKVLDNDEEEKEEESKEDGDEHPNNLNSYSGTNNYENTIDFMKEGFDKNVIYT